MVNLIILAAGVGSRLYPYTFNTPKCLIPIKAEQTLLEYTVNKFYGRTNITIVVGYEYDQIVSKYNKNCKIVYNPFYSITNSIASLWMAKDSFGDTTIVINSDIFLEDCIINDILDMSKTDYILCDSSKKYQDTDYKISVDNDKVIYMSKVLDSHDYFGEYSGVTKLSKANANLLINTMQKMIFNGEHDTWYETSIVRMIQNDNLQLGYTDIKGKLWAEIDTVEDLKRLKELM